MKKRYSKEQHDIIRDSRNFQRGNLPDQRVELAFSLSKGNTEQFATVTQNILKNKFAGVCDIHTKKVGEHFKVCMNKKNVAQRSVSQVEITITKDFMFNIHLNDYEHFEDYYYHGSKLSTTDLMTETTNITAFLDGQNVPENSKFEKIGYDDFES
jgi:hypothetical protein